MTSSGINFKRKTQVVFVHRSAQAIRSIYGPKIGVPKNGWFIMENHIKIRDLGVPGSPIFGSTPIEGNHHGRDLQTASKKI